MSYSESFDKSARRHLDAADLLDDEAATRPKRCRPIAGYLYGVAAECALKKIMRASGIRPLPPERRRDDPHYAHFPQLKTMLRDGAHGHRGGELRRYANDPSLMVEWSTDMRYSPGGDIDTKWVDRWREQAHTLVDKMEGA